MGNKPDSHNTIVGTTESGAVRFHDAVTLEETGLFSPHVGASATLEDFVPAKAVEQALGVDRETLREHNRSLRPAVEGAGRLTQAQGHAQGLASLPKGIP